MSGEIHTNPRLIREGGRIFVFTEWVERRSGRIEAVKRYDVTDDFYEDPNEPWRQHARASGCYCANTRKPCTYHEGWQDGYDIYRVLDLADLPNRGQLTVEREP